MQILDISLQGGYIIVYLEGKDDDHWAEITAEFECHIDYEDTSFSHAFGIEYSGHYELKIDNIRFNVTEQSGEPIDYDRDDVINEIFHEFDDNYHMYVRQITDEIGG